MKEVIELLERRVFVLEYDLKSYERGAIQPYGDAPYCKKKILELNESLKYFNEAIKILNKKIMVVKMKILKCGYISEDNIRCEFIENNKRCKFHDYCKYQRVENNYCGCDHDGKEVKMVYVCKVCNREVKTSKTLISINA